MARYEITAPGGGYDEEIAGVRFTGGRATAEDPAPGALLYFRRHGYTVAPLDALSPTSLQNASGDKTAVQRRSRARKE
ncbi:hypothetical protein ACFWAT_14255 [Streptomyces syringium]|uniref:hypothetical protein n=1 Tax=Streptomyces syringium TaxID=76729 RepID=UPI00364708E3